MRRALILFATLALATLALAACGPRYDVRSDHDPSIDFAAYKSFSVLPRTTADTPDQLDNSLTLKRIEAIVVRQLEARGLARVASGGDLTVRFWAISKERVSYRSTPVMSPFFYPYPGPMPFPYARWSPMFEETIARTYLEGTLVLDLLDPKRGGELVWRSYVVGTVQSDRDATFKALEEALARGLAGFPPGPAEAR